MNIGNFEINIVNFLHYLQCLITSKMQSLPVSGARADLLLWGIKFDEWEFEDLFVNEGFNCDKPSSKLENFIIRLRKQEIRLWKKMVIQKSDPHHTFWQNRLHK